MSRQVWLWPNRRALRLVALLPLSTLALGAALLVLPGPFTAVVGGIITACSLGAVAAVLYTARQPRIAYEEGQLLVYLRRSGPVGVPVMDVECFFLGKAQTRLLLGREVPTATIVVRLAEAATQWRKVEVNPELGRWSDGYITIHGAWTEPIDAALLERLNNLLKSAHRETAREEGGRNR